MNKDPLLYEIARFIIIAKGSCRCVSHLKTLPIAVVKYKRHGEIEMRCRSELKYGGRAKVPKSGWKQGSLQDCECVVMFSTVA